MGQLTGAKVEIARRLQVLKGSVILRLELGNLFINLTPGPFRAGPFRAAVLLSWARCNKEKNVRHRAVTVVVASR